MPTFLDKINKLDEELIEGALLEFLIQYKFVNNDFHFFYEGYEDPSFYSGILNKMITEDCHQYIGNGKYKLYHIHNYIDWSKYKKNRVLFFTDRDYTELIGEELLLDENIYVTDFYSIENHVVDSNVLKRIITEIFHITNTNKVLEIENKFNSEYQSFFNGILYLSAWIIYLKRNQVKLTLNEIDLSYFFTLSDDLILKTKRGKNTEYLEKVTGVKTPENSWKDILSTIKELKKMNPKLVIRGKFEVWFFMLFLRKLKDSLPKKKNIKTHLTQSNCVEICAPRIETPESLLKFIRFNYSRIV